jgi:hypothetical protein
VKWFTEALQRVPGTCPAFSVASAKTLKRMEQAMKKILTAIALILGFGLFSAPSFAATGYVVNGHAASPAEAQALASDGVHQGNWVVNGYGVAPADHASFETPAPAETASSGKKCYYVLDVLLCD